MTWLNNLILASRPKPPATGTRLIALFIVIIFGGGGILILVSASLTPILKSANSHNWLPTPATVTKSELKTVDGLSRIHITYTYQHNGITHQGNRYSFDESSTNIGVGDMKKIIASHPPGTAITAYIDPQNPTQSVITRNLPLITYLGIPFSIPFLTVGICALGYALLSPHLHRQYTKIKNQILPLTEPTNATLIQKFLTHSKLPDHQELFYLPGEKTKQLLGLTFICLFWNGIVTLFLFVMIIALISGEAFGFFLAIFLIPFVLIGIKILSQLLKTHKLPPPPTLLIAAEINSSDPDDEQVTIQWLNTSKRTPKNLGFITHQQPHLLDLPKIFKKSPPIEHSTFHLIPKNQLNTGTIQLPIQLKADPKKQNHLAGASLKILYKSINHSTQTIDLLITPHPNEE